MQMLRERWCVGFWVLVVQVHRGSSELKIFVFKVYEIETFLFDRCEKQSI